MKIERMGTGKKWYRDAANLRGWAIAQTDPKGRVDVRLIEAQAIIDYVKKGKK